MIEGRNGGFIKGMYHYGKWTAVLMLNLFSRVRDDLKVVSFDQLSFDEQLFVTTFAYSYINLFEGFDENIVPFKDYSPPPLIRDVQILDQIFLI